MKTLINIRADEEVKESAQRLAKELGFPLSAVINAYLKEFIREQSLRISVEPRLRPEIGALLKKASLDYKRSRNLSPRLHEISEIKKYLHSK